MNKAHPSRFLLYAALLFATSSCGESESHADTIRLQDSSFKRLTDLVLDSGEFNRASRSIQYVSSDRMNILLFHIGSHDRTITVWSRMAGDDARGVSYLPLIMYSVYQNDVAKALITDRPGQLDTIPSVIENLLARTPK